MRFKSADIRHSNLKICITKPLRKSRDSISGVEFSIILQKRISVIIYSNSNWLHSNLQVFLRIWNSLILIETSCRFANNQTDNVAGLNQTAKNQRKNRNLVTMKYNVFNFILTTFSLLIFLIIRNDLAVMIYLVVVSCGSPLVYLLGMEENRRKTQLIFRSKIELFYKNKTNNSEAKHESNQQPFPIVNGWI